MEAAKLRPRVAIRPDGTMIISDLWDGFGLVGPIPAAPGVYLQSKPQRTEKQSIGILDFGLLHGEEPAVSGANGTGAIYIHGCPLKCATCYQPEFFAPSAPRYASSADLVQLMLDFQSAGAFSISLIISTYQDPVRRALSEARAQGLKIPVVYKYSGMLSTLTLNRLDGLVDIYLPDLKALSPELVRRHGLPPNYPEKTVPALRRLMESNRQVIVRHLLIPDFSATVSEIENMFAHLPFAETRTPLSLLTHFFDPVSRQIQTASSATRQDIENLAARYGVSLLIQGKGDYVSYQT